MVNILEAAAKFSPDTCKTKWAAQLRNYDDYDHKNNVAAVTFLTSSIDSSLWLTFEKHVTEKHNRINDPFPVLWCRLIVELTPVSLDAFKTTMAQVHVLKPSQVEGQSMKLMMSDFCRLAKALSDAGAYAHDLTLNVVDALLTAGGDTHHNAVPPFMFLSPCSVPRFMNN